MFIIALTHPKQLEWLQHVIATYTGNGLPPGELAVAADTHAAVSNAREIAVDQNLGPAKLTAAGPNGITLELGDEDPGGDPA